MLIPLFDVNKTSRFPVITVLLIISNVLIFIYTEWIAPSKQLIYLKYGFVSSRFLDNPFSLEGSLGLITYMFLHGGFFHILGNMWFLWIFGNNVEDVIGRFKFIVFFVITGILAALTQTLVGVIRDTQSLTVPLVGASGAISGILGAYLRLFPRALVATLVVFFIITMISVPAQAYILVWFIIQVFQGILSPSTSGIAWFAHIGGFIAGYLLIPLFYSRKIYYDDDQIIR